MTDLKIVNDVLLEEEILVLRICLRIFPKALVRNHDIIGRKHHESASLLVLKLLRSIPLSPDPPSEGNKLPTC